MDKIEIEGLGDTADKKNSLRMTAVEKEVEIEGKSKSKKKKVENNITDKGSAMAAMVFAGGSIVGPMAGGALFDSKGYDFTCEVMSGSALVFAVAYLVIVFLPMKKQ